MKHQLSKFTLDITINRYNSYKAIVSLDNDVLGIIYINYNNGIPETNKHSLSEYFDKNFYYFFYAVDNIIKQQK